MGVFLTGCFLCKITVISFRRFILRLQESDGIGDIGGISLKNVICM